MPHRAEPNTMASFADALLDPTISPPAGLAAPRSTSLDRRFAVYRNNVTVGLVNALAETFPTVSNLVGEDYFRAMARIYVQDHPPSSPRMMEYGRDFPDFIATFEPARDLPFLPDVARLERLWLDSFHAEDAPILDPSALGRIAPDLLADVRLVLHPAARIMRSTFAVTTILSRDRSGQSMAGFNPLDHEDSLITRPQYDVELRHLPPGCFLFLEALAKGHSLGEAASRALEDCPEADLATLIASALSAGAFTTLQMGHL